MQRIREGKATLMLNVLFQCSIKNWSLHNELAILYVGQQYIPRIFQYGLYLFNIPTTTYGTKYMLYLGL